MNVRSVVDVSQETAAVVLKLTMNTGRPRKIKLREKGGTKAEREEMNLSRLSTIGCCVISTYISPAMTQTNACRNIAKHERISCKTRTTSSQHDAL